MKTSTVVAIIIVLVIIVGGWYWWSSQPISSNTAADTSAEGQAPPQSPSSDPYAYQAGNLLLGTDADAELGTYLIAYNGLTLYTYTRDTENVSNCSGQCAAQWPPYTVASADVLQNVQAGISGKVGTITRADGSLQVTYNGEPLYFWINDHQSGDTTGQGVGGVWFVVKP